MKKMKKLQKLMKREILKNIVHFFGIEKVRKMKIIKKNWKIEINCRKKQKNWLNWKK